MPRSRVWEAKTRIDGEINGEVVKHTLTLTTVPMPFGGRRAFLICAAAGKRCLTPHRFRNRLGGRFAHREAFPGACYSIRPLSKADRIFVTKHRTEEAIGKVGLKTHDDGKSPRRFSILTRELERVQEAELLMQPSDEPPPLKVLTNKLRSLKLKGILSHLGSKLQ